MKGKKLLCAVSAWILSVSLIPGAVFGAQEDPGSQTIDPGRIIGTVMEQVQKAADSITMPDFEGSVHVVAADGLRTAIADHYHSEDDMSWIEDAQIVLQGTMNDTRGVDLEATFEFNGTELYHLQLSFDHEKNILYLECPELKEEVFAFPIGDFTADAQTITGKKITAEKLAEYTTCLRELNDLVKSVSLETLQAEWTKYLLALGKYIQTEKGFATITAGSLTEEGNTTTWSVAADDLEELIPEALMMLSEDELLAQIMTSPFADHVFRLMVGGKASKLIPQGALWQFVQQWLVQAAGKDYSKGRSVSATLALDRNNTPVQLSVSMEKNQIQAELFRINAIADGSDHALEVKLGTALLKAAKIRLKHPCGLVIQGNLKDDILIETVSVHTNGMTVPVFTIRNLDLLAIQDIWLSGAFTAFWKDQEFTCDFYTDEDGLRTMRFDEGGEEWFTLTADLQQSDSVELDTFDTSDASLVDSRKAFFKYMRDASAIRMFEKLASADVPQEYVDMLTDGEAATESSRENTVELEE